MFAGVETALADLDATIVRVSLADLELVSATLHLRVETFVSADGLGGHGEYARAEGASRLHLSAPHVKLQF